LPKWFFSTTRLAKKAALKNTPNDVFFDFWKISYLQTIGEKRHGS